MKIGHRTLGPGHPCYVIAEAGSNHNGDQETALQLVDAAAKAGADAVKFQLYTGAELYSTSTPAFSYLGEELGSRPIVEVLDEVALAPEWIPELRSRAEAAGAELLVTPFSPAGVEVLRDSGMSALKVASFEIADLPLLRSVGAAGLPVLLSTGMSTMAEIGEALAVLRDAGAPAVTLMQCTSLYPAPPETMNLRSIQTLRERFGVPVGLSDHSLGIHLSIAAVALGAVAIEKHFTLDRGQKGPDHSFAIEPHELARMVSAIRETEQALGDGVKEGPNELEAEEMFVKARRSVVAATRIPAGTVVGLGMLTTKRPGTGIKPGDISAVVGRVAAVDIEADEILTWDRLVEP